MQGLFTFWSQANSQILRSSPSQLRLQNFWLTSLKTIWIFQIFFAHFIVMRSYIQGEQVVSLHLCFYRCKGTTCSPCIYFKNSSCKCSNSVPKRPFEITIAKWVAKIHFRPRQSWTKNPSPRGQDPNPSFPPFGQTWFFRKPPPSPQGPALSTWFINPPIG